MAKSGSKRKKKKKVSKAKKPHTFSFPALNLRHFSIMALFVALAFGLYWTSLSDDFILDDKIVISENIYTQEGIAGWWDHLTSDSFKGFFKGEQKNLLTGGRYRPLSLLVFSALYELFGDWTLPYHVVNVFLYGLTAGLLFFLLQILGRKSGRDTNQMWFSVPFIAAILYLFHPIHIEAVANIKGLDEILTFLFAIFSWFVALKLYNRPNLLGSLGLGLLFFAGLLAKENAITFLAVIPLSLYVFGKPGRKQLAYILTPLLLSTAAYLIIRYQVLGFFLDPGVEITDILNNPFYGLNTEERLGTVLFTWLKYLGLLIFPHPLVHDYYPYAIPISTLSDGAVILSMSIHLLLLAYGIWAGLIKHRWDGFAILFYFITFSIVSNLLFTVGTFMNERFIYISSLGFCILLAYGLSRAAQKLLSTARARAAIGIITVGILSAYAWKTYDRLPDWRSYTALNASAVEHYPTSARSTLFMGTALFNEAMATSDPQEKLEKLKESEYWIDQSLSVFPNYGNRTTRNFKYYNAYKMKAGVTSEIYKLEQDLGSLLNVFLFVGKDKPHIPYLLEFLGYVQRRSPDRGLMTNFYHQLAYQELAVNQRKLNFGMNYIQKGLEYMPNNALLLYDKGRIYQMAGQQEEAQRFINQARAIDPQIESRG